MSGKPTKVSAGLPDVLTERAVRRLQQQLNTQDREHFVKFVSITEQIGDIRQVVVQVQDKEGTNLAGRFLAKAWLAVNPDVAPSTTAVNFNIAGYSDAYGMRQVMANKKYQEFVTDADGQAVINIEQNSAQLFWLNVLVVGRIESTQVAFV
jgi:hypothetical protein